jgi:hypothetical protein
LKNHESRPPSLPNLTHQSLSPSNALHHVEAPRLAVARQTRPSPSQDATSNPTEDCHHSKFYRCHSPQGTEYVFHKTSGVMNDYTGDVYPCKGMLPIYLARALLMIQIEIDENPPQSLKAHRSRAGGPEKLRTTMKSVKR